MSGHELSTLRDTPPAIELAQFRADIATPSLSDGKGSKKSGEHSEYSDVRLTPSTSPAPPPAEPVQNSKVGDFLKRLLASITVYKIIFAVIFTANAVVLISLAALDRLVPANSLNAVATNVFVAVLMRQEHLINLFFAICTSMASPDAPFALRKRLANFHHFGGVHSGCSTSALIWYASYSILSTKQVAMKTKSWTTLTVVDTTAQCAVLALLGAMTFTSLPSIRRKVHDVFELTHRFAGWLSIFCLWLHTIIGLVKNKAETPAWKDGSLYLLSLTTLLILTPWLQVRRVPIRVERMSSQETCFSFDYKNMPTISTMRFSTSPLFEWHAFATIPSSSKTAARIVISKAGDWTTKMIENPPSHLYLRCAPTYNFLKSVPMFKSVLIVATGSGIGPVLSLLSSIQANGGIDQSKVGIKVIWCQRNPYACHWNFAMNLIRSVDPSPNVIDTTNGRPDLMEVVKAMVDSYEIEGVFVVSKFKITNMIVNAVNSWDDGRLGKDGRIAAFGAVFDS